MGAPCDHACRPIKCRLQLMPSSFAMPLFWKPYKSDVTQFIDSLKQRDPQLEERQRQGRALLWDKSIDREAQQEWREARVPQQPYVYQAKG
jgi:hypothetical protein